MGKMTASERSGLATLIRKRERVMKQSADQRAAELLAEFDRQSAAIYSFDDDEIWQEAAERAQQVVLEAQQVVQKRCEELGIPPEFAPGLQVHWYGRGQNAVASRRTELRRMVKSKIEANRQKTRTEIEKLSLQAQTEVIASGLESDAARHFLEAMPSVDAMMPELDTSELKKLVDAKYDERERRQNQHLLN